MHVTKKNIITCDT